MTHDDETSATPETTPGASDEPRHPVVLFDGPCNLCHAAVQWILERDPEGRFRFASLQSQAGRDVLAGHDVTDADGSAPDSVVLVDDEGAHVRSTAMLRIARHLGLPYSLLGLFLVLPRFLRDAAYRLIAANRYRWFGKQTHCLVPTPNLSARFLDADEPPIVIEPTEDDAPSSGERRSVLTAWLARLALAYVLIHMAPYLRIFGSLPLVGPAFAGLASLPGLVLDPLYVWLGRTLLGVEVSTSFTGSGDTTFDYIETFIELGMALVASLVWLIATRARPIPGVVWSISHVVARYYLGTWLLIYGWIKLFPLQFPSPGPDRLIQPYGDSSPMGLAWTFMGASTAYQMFAGLSELIGGYLLFWRRTSLLGALVSAAVMTNVMALNFFYDVPVKLFSTHLVLIAIFIMAPDIPRLLSFLVFNLPVKPRSLTPPWSGKKPWALIIGLAHLAFVLAITATHVTRNLETARQRGPFAEPAPLTGIYRVETFEHDGRAGRENEDQVRWVRVGVNAPWVATVQRASGDATRMRLALDTDAKTISFVDRGAQPPETPDFTYTEPEDGVLRLEGRLDGKPTIIVLREDAEGALLVERGFRWVNEYPFNR
ncbi:MAG: thiol-disulfide oxidoreductase DCC family protein [Acidobacteriota bacterium]